MLYPSELQPRPFIVIRPVPGVCHGQQFGKRFANPNSLSEPDPRTNHWAHFSEQRPREDVWPKLCSLRID
jgi:hypothetical protein